MVAVRTTNMSNMHNRNACKIITEENKITAKHVLLVKILLLRVNNSKE